MHLTIEETDEGTLICLLLQPSETSSELRAFASSLPGRSQPLLRPSSTERRIVSRPVAPVQLQNLELGGARSAELRGLQDPDSIFPTARDRFLDDLEETIATQDRALGGAVGKLSRVLAQILPFEGETISQQLSLGTGLSMGEVHIRMVVPFLGLPRIGREFTGVIQRDFERDAVGGNLPELRRSRATIQKLRESIAEALALGKEFFVGGFGDPISDAIGQAQLLRAELNLRKMEKAAEVNIKKAERFRRGD